MFQKFKNFLKQKKCDHQMIGPAVVKGKPGEWEPHPHPGMATRYEIKRAPFAIVGVCFKCGKIDARTGYDETACRIAGTAEEYPTPDQTLHPDHKITQFPQQR